MPSKYVSKNVKCPFCKEETRNTIKCEGIFSETCTFNFANPTNKKEHKEKYCNHFSYKNCPHAKQVNAKYP